MIPVLLGVFLIWACAGVLVYRDRKARIRQEALKKRMRTTDPRKLGDTVTAQMSGYFQLSHDTMDFLERALETIEYQEEKRV